MRAPCILESNRTSLACMEFPIANNHKQMKKNYNSHTSYIWLKTNLSMITSYVFNLYHHLIRQKILKQANQKTCAETPSFIQNVSSGKMSSSSVTYSVLLYTLFLFTSGKYLLQWRNLWCDIFVHLGGPRFPQFTFIGHLHGEIGNCWNYGLVTGSLKSLTVSSSVIISPPTIERKLNEVAVVFSMVTSKV